jgi:signal transduction histidine kinase
MNSVPPSATSNSPCLAATAPVNDPFSCPNSSLSSRLSGRAAQLITTNGLSARRLARCRARATSSFPVPLSPWIRIALSVGLADSVITALSNFAKLPVPNREAFAVEECVRRAVELSDLPGDIEVAIDCPAGLPPALGDSGQALIVLGNLIRNARDAMPRGGKLTVRARQADERIEVSVADTGPGIEPENLQRVLEPFYSTRARGIGLGLAISRAILDKNDGTLSVESVPGEGATVPTNSRRAANPQ